MVSRWLPFANEASLGGTTGPNRKDLVELTESLSRINVLTGDELMKVADRFQTLAGIAAGITAESRAISELLSGEECHRAIVLLHDVMSQTDALETAIRDGSSRLSVIGEDLKKIVARIARMGRLGAMLSTVGVYTRIESERLRDISDGTLQLPDAIRVLAREIQDYLDEISEKAGSAGELVVKASAESKDQNGDQGSKTIIGQTQALLISFEQRMEKAGAAAVEIDLRYDEIRRSIEKTVMSLQVQDIARQRIEHVQEALARIEESPAWTSKHHTVLQLQRRQLVETRDLLLRSIDEIGTSVDSASAEISKLAEKTSQLSVLISEDQGDGNSKLEQGIEAVRALYMQHAESSRELLSVFNAVRESANSIASGVQSLEKLRFRLRLAALNASIETDRFGVQGAALQVLSSEVQTIVDQSCADTDSLMQALVSMTQHESSEISSDRAGCMQTEFNPTEIGSSIEGVSEDLTTARTTTLNKISQVVRLADRLSSELVVREQLTDVRHSMCSIFDDVLNRFDLLVAQCSSANKCSGAVSSEELGGSELATLYSMESERKAHDEYFGNESASAMPGTQNELDDGVELF